MLFRDLSAAASEIDATLIVQRFDLKGVSVCPIRPFARAAIPSLRSRTPVARFRCRRMWADEGQPDRLENSGEEDLLKRAERIDGAPGGRKA
jgi:hypothetical protein